MHPAKAPTRASETRRVRAQVEAHLGWVHGWPLAVDGAAVRWQIVPPPGRMPEVVVLDAQALGRAARCWAKTNGEYRRTFERAVQDPAAWSLVVPVRLRQLRDALDGRIPARPDARTAVELAFATRPEREAARACAGEEVLPEDPVLAVVLAWLHVRHGAAVSPLLELLRGPEPALAEEGVPARLRAALDQDGPPVARDAGAWHAAVAAWAGELTGLRDGPRALALGWLPAALPTEAIAAWVGWWDSVERVARQVRSAVAAHGPRAGTLEAAARAAIHGLPKAPAPLAPTRALAAATALARAGVRPSGGLVRLGIGAPAVLSRWSTEMLRPGGRRLLQRIEADLAAGRLPPDQLPEEDELLDGLDPLGSWRAGLLLLAEGVPLSEPTWRFLVAVHDLHPASAQARTRAAADAGWQEWPWKQALEKAHRAAPLDARRFVELARLLHDGGDLHEVAGVLGARLPEAVRAVGKAPLVDAGLRMKLLRGLEGTVPPFPGGVGVVPDALAHVPEALHDALRALAAVHPEPVRAARAVLDRDLPPSDHLLGQIEALSARSDPGAVARVERLRARLAAPPALGAGRLANLEVKLRDAALRVALDRWREALSDAMRASVRERWGDDPGPLDVRAVRILAGVAKLEAPYRALFERLLAKRRGPPPWDLRDDPVSIAWRARMEARGLDLGPWLDPPTLRTGGLVLEVARDPLDVLWMGGPFDTCLAPDGCNFFSAVVNAADPDKRVLFVRKDGEIVGRCLLALTETGGLLTFHVYGGIPIEPVSAWVETLAGAMRTVVVPRGRVVPRLAPDWYDDGPRDLTGRFAFLSRGDAWLLAHDGDPPEAFVEALAAAMAPVPLGPVLMPAVLASAALASRPERIVLLLPFLGPDTDPETRMRAASLLLRTGRADLAWRLGGEAIASVLGQRAADGWGALEPELVRLWIAHDPVRALRALRKRADAAELVAEALEALGRPLQAARVRQPVGRP